MSFRALSSGGSGVDDRCVWGVGEKKRGMRLHDRASAMQFSRPGWWTRDIVKLCCVMMKKSVLNSSMIPRCLDDWLAHAWTIGRLSQWNQIRLPG